LGGGGVGWLGGWSFVVVFCVLVSVMGGGGRGGLYIRKLIARRVGMLGCRMRVMCWTEDVGRDEWHL